MWKQDRVLVESVAYPCPGCRKYLPVIYFITAAQQRRFSSPGVEPAFVRPTLILQYDDMEFVRPTIILQEYRLYL